MPPFSLGAYNPPRGIGVEKHTSFPICRLDPPHPPLGAPPRRGGILCSEYVIEDFGVFIPVLFNNFVYNGG